MIGSRWLLVVGLLLALPANADDTGEDPPVEFRHGDTLKPVIVKLIPDDEVQTVCRSDLHNGRRMMACIHMNTADCTVYISDFLASNPRFNGTFNFVKDPKRHNGLFQRVLEHEMAHCRGWPADHPQ